MNPLLFYLITSKKQLTKPCIISTHSTTYFLRQKRDRGDTVNKYDRLPKPLQVILANPTFSRIKGGALFHDRVKR